MCWIDCFAFEAARRKDWRRGDARGERFERSRAVLSSCIAVTFWRTKRRAWAGAYREELRARCLQVVERAGDRLESSARPAMRSSLPQGAATRSGGEPIYRRLIRSLACRGEKAEAVEVYRRCREMLSIVLNAQPAPETERLYDSLR